MLLCWNMGKMFSTAAPDDYYMCNIDQWTASCTHNFKSKVN